MRVVGIDPSLTSTGVACIELADDGALNVAVNRVQSAGHRAATLDERMVRLNNLVHRIGWDTNRRPDLVVIEGPAFSRNNAGTWDRAGLWWLVVRHMFEAELEVVVVPPNVRAKYATGKGTAGKDEVLAAVVRRYPGVEVRGNDEADALVLAAMGARHLGHSIEESLPASHQSVMDKVEWPVPEAA